MAQYPPNNPYQPPNNPYASPQNVGGGPMGPQGTNVSGKVVPPGIALIVCGILGILFGLFDLAMRIFNLSTGGLDNFGGPREAVVIGAIGGGVLDLVIVVCQIIVAVGGYYMMKQRNISLARSAAVISCVPCISTCCLLGIPFGIWALIVLADPMVKKSFR